MSGNARNSRTTHPNKKSRREEAEARQAVYDALPLTEKVARAGKKQLQRFVANGGEAGELAEKRLKEFA